MPHTYTQLYVHIIFGVKNRSSLIPRANKEELHKYITGIVANKQCKMVAINSEPDHIHILASLHAKLALTDLIRDIKANSTTFVKKKGWNNFFGWQEGFGAFSCSESHKQEVIRYIENQEIHHRKKSFREEYLEFLKVYRIPYDPRYVFDPEETLKENP